MEEKRRGRPPKEVRPARVPMSGQQLRMSIPEEYKDPAFHYVWITDKKDFLYRAKNAGYVHVTTAEMPHHSHGVDSSVNTESNVSMPVGFGEVGYLMKQPIEYHLEDLDEKRKFNQSRIADIKKDLNSGKNGTYGDVEFK
jgi:hypothetical protein